MKGHQFSGDHQRLEKGHLCPAPTAKLIPSIIIIIIWKCPTEQLNKQDIANQARYMEFFLDS